MEQLMMLEAAIDACASQLEHLNNQFPHLATTSTLQGVEHWCGRSKPQAVIEASEPSPGKPEQAVLDVRAVAISMLADHSLEDVLELLLEQHDIDLSLAELVHLIGHKNYKVVLKRDLRELLKNAISYDQISNLWNDLDRPALGSSSWNSRSVSLLDS